MHKHFSIRKVTIKKNKYFPCLSPGKTKIIRIEYQTFNFFVAWFVTDKRSSIIQFEKVQAFDTDYMRSRAMCTIMGKDKIE